MKTQATRNADVQTSSMPIMTDPEWIALESLDERTRHFIFDDTMLDDLHRRGFVEPQDGHWRVTPHGHRALGSRQSAQSRV